MKDQLITLKTAKLAKEKKFNLRVLHFYCKNRTCNYLIEPCKYSFEVDGNQESKINGEIDNFGYGITWSAPTQSHLQKWLREIHSISINIDDYITDGKVKFDYRVKELGNQDFEDNGPYKTYEKALEIALQEALKLVK